MNWQISTPTTTVTELAVRLSSTPRGARLARRLTANQLANWGHPYGGDVNDTAQHLVAELAANAVTHGRVPGRDFELRLRLLREDTLRIEVTDARGEKKLRLATVDDEEGEDDEGGRGLILVSLLSHSWGVTERAVGKTVWAELPLTRPRPAPGTGRPCRRRPGPAD